MLGSWHSIKSPRDFSEIEKHSNAKYKNDFVKPEFPFVFVYRLNNGENEVMFTKTIDSANNWIEQLTNIHGDEFIVIDLYEINLIKHHVFSQNFK